MTLAKYRKVLGKKLKADYGLPHVAAFRLAKLAKFHGEENLGVVFPDRKAKVLEVLAAHAPDFKLVEKYTRCCSDPSHGLQFDSLSFEKVEKVS